MNRYLLTKILHGFVGLAITILSKSKVPISAAVNGMQVPEKPAFFDLNELECRLLARRLAFQKLIQAPTEGRLNFMAILMYQPMLILQV